MHKQITQQKSTSIIVGNYNPTHPDEIDRVKGINPHGFIDMNTLFDKIKELYQLANNNHYDARFSDGTTFMTISSGAVDDAVQPTDAIVITFGMEQINTQPDKILGTLECLYFLGAKEITVYKSESVDNEPVSPTMILRSIKQNNLVNLPMIKLNFD